MASVGEEEFSATMPWPSKFAKDHRYDFEAPQWLDFEKLDDFLFNEEDDDEWFCRSDCRHGKTVFKSDEVLKGGMDVTNQQKSPPSRRSAGSIHLPKRTIATPLNDNTQRFLTKKPAAIKDKNNENAIGSSKLPGVNKNKSQVRNSKHDLYSENQHPNKPNSIFCALKAKRKSMPRSSNTMKDAVKLRQNANSSDGDKVIQFIGSNPDHQDALQNHKIHADQLDAPQNQKLDAPQNQKIHAGQDQQVVLAATKVSEIEAVEVSKMGKFKSYHPKHEKGESSQNPQRFRDLLGLDIDQAETDEEIPMKKRMPRPRTVCTLTTKAPAATYDFQEASFCSGLKQSSSARCLWDKMKSNRRVEKVSSFCSNMLPFHVQKVHCKFTSNEAKPNEELKLGDMNKHEMPEKQEHETADIEHESAQAFLHGCSATLKNPVSYKKSMSASMFKIAKWKKQNNHEKEQRDGDEGDEHSQSNLPTYKKFKLTNIFKPNKWAK